MHQSLSASSIRPIIVVHEPFATPLAHEPALCVTFGMHALQQPPSACTHHALSAHGDMQPLKSQPASLEHAIQALHGLLWETSELMRDAVERVQGNSRVPTLGLATSTWRKACMVSMLARRGTSPAG